MKTSDKNQKRATALCYMYDHISKIIWSARNIKTCAVAGDKLQPAKSIGPAEPNDVLLTTLSSIRSHCHTHKLVICQSLQQ